MVTTHTLHTVSASTFWLPCMTLHYTWIILLMVLDLATLSLSHLLDSKLYPCDLLISIPWHYAVSRSSLWWTCVMLHSICIILLITFDPKLCLHHVPHDTIMLDTIFCLHPLCDNHRRLWICPLLWVHVLLLYDSVIALTMWASFHSKSPLWQSCVLLHICLIPLLTICDYIMLI